jgi:cytidyltransferase-like protein
MTKIVSLNQIPQSKNLVLVTGVFDIIHSEHIKFLNKAKSKGSLLVVGLEPDLRVKNIKGKSRPINTIKQRLKAIAALSIADYIFPLPSNLNTKSGRESLIKKIRPGLLAVSASTPNLTEKRRVMKLVGGTVKIVLPHNPNISTTKLISTHI